MDECDDSMFPIYIMKADCQSKLSAINHNLRVLFQYGGKCRYVWNCWLYWL